MAKIYVSLIIKGERTLEDIMNNNHIPQKIKDEVKELLEN